MVEIKDARSLSPDAQEALRLRAVRAVLDGMTQGEAARQFGIARTTVNSWVCTYRRRGQQALKARKQGRPPGGKRIAGWQAGQIVQAISDRTPDQLKLPFMLWTRETVCSLIQARTGVSYSLGHLGRLLRHWGFTPQKPARRALEQNPEAVEYWLKERYPAIQRRAKAEKGEIHWGDEMGMRSDHQTGRTYGRKGQTPVITKTGKRFSGNMISSITNRGTLRFMLFKGSFSANVFIDFLRRLTKSRVSKVFLIVDGHSVHRSAKVKKWLQPRKDKIEIFYLPPYSPELNPDEFLNNDVKSNAVGRVRAASQEELLGNVRSYLRSTQRQPAIVRKYFHAKPVQYAM